MLEYFLGARKSVFLFFQVSAIKQLIPPLNFQDFHHRQLCLCMRRLNIP